MKLIILLFLTHITFAAKTEVITKDMLRNKTNYPQKEDYAQIGKFTGLDSFYDPKIDYSKFSGRVSDKSSDGTIYKIQTESKNIKFFKASDTVEFKLAKYRDRDPCSGNIRSVEPKYITIFVKSLYPCWGEAYNFRRGTILILESKRLAKRIRDASIYRTSLITKKRDYLKQLNNVNEFIWGFSQKQVDVAAQFDRQIIEIKKRKEQAMNLLLAKKKDQVRIQKELTFRLDEVDQDLEFFRVEKDELFTDRWHMDQELGIPVYKRPQSLKDR